MAPAFGTTLDSAALVDMFAALPGWFATSLKGAVAAAGSYHTLNGLRHLSWDMGYRESLCKPDAPVGPRDGGFRANPAGRLKFGLASSVLVLTSILTVLDLKTSYMAGYVVLGATALSTAAILAL